MVCCRPGCPDSFYIYSTADAGKVKRIRNNPRVRVAPCDIRGNLRGAWVDGQARICSGQDAAKGQELLRQKYWMKIIGDFFNRMRGGTQAVLQITLG